MGDRVKRLLALVLAAFFITLLAAAPAWTQNTGGRVVGVVSDEQGGLVPGAKVTVTNTGTQVNYNATTDKDGYFEVLDLPIGNYHVTVEHEGFSKAVTQEKKLEINQSLRFEITIKVGTQTQTVTVEANVAGVETVSPTIGQTVSGAQIANTPLNGRDVLDLALLQPGVTEADPDYGGAGNYSVGGGRPDSVTFLLDGGLNNNLLDNSIVLNPNPDTIAEFRILTSDYTAEYGRNASGVISIVTKSGTNEFHGSAFEYLRNDDFNANDYFNKLHGIPRNNEKRNQYGGTFGGPLSFPHVFSGKDRFFFFVAYQGQRLVQTETQNSIQTFTPAELGGDFSNSYVGGTNTGPDPYVAAFLQANPYFQSNPALAAQAIIDPTKIDPIAQEYISHNFIPTSPNGLLTSAAGFQNNNNELTGKLDFAVTSKDKISFTIGGFRNPQLNPYQFASVNGFPNTSQINNYFGNIAYIRTINNNLLNEFRFTAQRNNDSQDEPGVSLPTASTLGINTFPDNPTGPPNLYFDTGLQIGLSEQGPTKLINNTYGYADTVTWVKGHNTWKFGAGFSAYQNNTLYDYYINGEFDFLSEVGQGTGNSLADFFIGAVNSYFQYPQAPSNIRSKATYGFFQDEWRAKSNLTLTMGLRYEYNTPKLDTQGRTFSIIPGEQSTVFTNAPVSLVFPGDPGAPRGVNFPQTKNFGPRFGFAWDPKGNGKTSIRGGAGIFYDVLKGEDNLQFNGQPPFFSSAGLFLPAVGPGQVGPIGSFQDPFGVAGVPDPFPSTPPSHDLDFAAAGFLPLNSGGSVYYVNPHLHTPYTYQYNLSVQRQIAPSTVAEINYVGSSSKGLTGLEDVNPFILGTDTRVLNAIPQTNPGIQAYCAGDAAECPFATAPEFNNVGFANFNSLEASLTRSPIDNHVIGTTYFTLAYTYGRGIDTSSGFQNRTSQVPYYNIQQFRAVSDSNVTHRITMSGGWDLPFDRKWESGPKRLTKGWSLYPIFTFRTGFPLSLPAYFPDRYDPTDPGPSGAGDPYVVNVLFAAGYTKLQRENPKTSLNNTYFNPNGIDYNEGDYAGAPAQFAKYGLPRNFFYGPGRVNLDLALAKKTNITERVDLEFRAEAFNVFNHTEFSNPNVNPYSGVYGQITNTIFDSARVVQLALRLGF
jgi:hypothetical protein